MSQFYKFLSAYFLITALEIRHKMGPGRNKSSEQPFLYRHLQCFPNLETTDEKIFQSICSFKVKDIEMICNSEEAKGLS